MIFFLSDCSVQRGTQTKNLLTACQKETQTNQKSERARPNGIYQKQWLADNLQRAIVFPSILWYSITQISMFGRYIAMPERNMVNLTITMTREESKALKQLALDKDITVSALVRLWLQEQQKVEVKG